VEHCQSGYLWECKANWQVEIADRAKPIMQYRFYAAKPGAYRAQAALCAIMLISAAVLPESKRRIALFPLETRNVTDVEVSIVSQFLGTGFVNAGKYNVLDRTYIDKILHEQIMPGLGIVSEVDAVNMGKILNVELIVVGSLTRLHGEYFLEVRMINVETSSIEMSKTAHCTSTHQLPDMAGRIVRQLSGEPPVVEKKEPRVVAQPEIIPEPVLDLSFTPMAQESALQVDSAEDKAGRWYSAGFSEYDFNRFVESGMSEQKWAESRRRVPVLAGAIGVVPLASGFYYSDNIATGALISIAEALGICGMILTLNNSSTVSKRMSQVFGKPGFYIGLAGTATLADIIGSIVSAARYNTKLDKLIGGNAGIRAGVDTRSLCVNIHIP
jgi:hypothetical protein